MGGQDPGFLSPNPVLFGITGLRQKYKIFDFADFFPWIKKFHTSVFYPRDMFFSSFVNNVK